MKLWEETQGKTDQCTWNNQLSTKELVQHGKINAAREQQSEDKTYGSARIE